MPSSCAAAGCTNSWKRHSDISFHRFPLNAERRSEWLRHVKRENFSASLHTFLCSEHFEDSCFDKTGQTIRLRAGAVPTIFNLPHRLRPKVIPSQKSISSTETPPLKICQTNISQEETISKDHNYCLTSPTAAKKRIYELEKRLEAAKKSIKIYQQRQRRVLRRWTAMKCLVEGLKKKSVLSSGQEPESMELEKLLGEIVF